MVEENNTNKYITEEYLDKKLDERMGEQTQVLLAAFDKRFDKLDKQISETKDELKRDINNVQTLIDGYVKAQEDFKSEFIIIKEEVRQIKEVIKEKLGLEIRAI